MRIALVSPYSWTYQGGVNRHVEALAEQFLARGDHVRVLAPWDPPDKLSPPPARRHSRGPRAARLAGPARAHRRHRRQRRSLEHRCLPGRPGPDAPRAALRQLRRRPRPRAARAPDLLGREHVSVDPGGRHVPRLLDQGVPEPDREPARRAQDLQPALGPHRRLAGGRVDGQALVRRRLHDRPQRGRRRSAFTGPKEPADHLRLLFVGRAEERKGLPILLSAYEALLEHVPTQLTVVGADPEEVERRIADPEVAEKIDVLGKVSHGVLWRELGEADVLVAPSLAGESFGMVLIEAMASGTPPVASRIAGYSDVVTDGARRGAGAPGRPAGPRRGAAAPLARARAPCRDGRGWPQERRALRLAAGRRRGGRGLRARDEAGARASRPHRGRRAPPRASSR